MLKQNLSLLGVKQKAQFQKVSPYKYGNSASAVNPTCQNYTFPPVSCKEIYGKVLTTMIIEEEQREMPTVRFRVKFCRVMKILKHDIHPEYQAHDYKNTSSSLFLKIIVLLAEDKNENLMTLEATFYRCN